MRTHPQTALQKYFLFQRIIPTSRHQAPPPASVGHWSPLIHVFPVGVNFASVLLALKKQTLHSVVLDFIQSNQSVLFA